MTTRKLLAIAMSAMLIAGQAHAENPNPFDAMIDQDRAGLYVSSDPFVAQDVWMQFAGTEAYSKCLGLNVQALAKRSNELAEIIVKATFGSCWEEAALVTPSLRTRFESVMQGKLLADVLLVRAGLPPSPGRPQTK
jgi:hypothetical protein